MHKIIDIMLNPGTRLPEILDQTAPLEARYTVAVYCDRIVVIKLTKSFVVLQLLFYNPFGSTKSNGDLVIACQNPRLF